MYRRNFGDAKDESEVVSATVNAEGLLNVMVYFPSLHQTREFGLLLAEGRQPARDLQSQRARRVHDREDAQIRRPAQRAALNLIFSNLSG